MPVSDPLPVHPRGRPEGALNQRGHGGTVLRAIEGRGGRAAQGRVRVQGRGGRIHGGEDRAQGRSSREQGAGAGVRGTRRNPSGFEIANIQLPSSATL